MKKAVIVIIVIVFLILLYFFLFKSTADSSDKEPEFKDNDSGIKIDCNSQIIKVEQYCEDDPKGRTTCVYEWLTKCLDCTNVKDLAGFSAKYGLSANNPLYYGYKCGTATGKGDGKTPSTKGTTATKTPYPLTQLGLVGGGNLSRLGNTLYIKSQNFETRPLTGTEVAQLYNKAVEIGVYKPFFAYGATFEFAGYKYAWQSNIGSTFYPNLSGAYVQVQTMIDLLDHWGLTNFKAVDNISGTATGKGG